MDPLVRELADMSVVEEGFQHSVSKIAEPVAIVGIGVRFPGEANTPEEFWQLLVDGRLAIIPLPTPRREGAAGWAEKLQVGGFLTSIAEFDAGFFKISPREAMYMDPQQRMLLEVSWQALEDAGYASNGESRMGVFVGMMNQHEYAKLQIQRNGPNYADEPYYGTGNSSNIAAGRLSRFLDAEGPSLTIDTACSSSLVAVHLACRSLRSRECDVALVAGVNALVLPEAFVCSVRMGMLSEDGRSIPFDASASGMVLGEGCGVVVLERLESALTHRHHIYALIRGTATNHDGATHGRLKPNPRAQSSVIRQALSDAARKPSDVAYVEAHGASTLLGDRSEVEALTEVFTDAKREAPVLVGSVKANIGHLVGAAGIAGLIKTVLSVSHGQVVLHPPAAGRPLQPTLVSSPLLATGCPWPLPGRSRIAGVSSFGWGGTNAHVVVEEAPLAEATSQGRGMYLLVLSARTGEALEEATRRLAAYLGKKREVDLADVAYTLQVGRKALEYRRAVVCGTFEEAITALAGSSSGTLMGRISVEQNGLDLSMDVDRLQWWVIGREATMNEEQDLKSLLEQVGRQWISGVKVDWSGLYGTERRRRVPLPTYPFEHKRYWIETKAGGAASAQGLLAQEPEKKSDIAEWFYVPSWKRSFSTEAEGSRGGTWLVLGEGELASAVAERLRERGVQVVMVEAGERFAAIARDRYRIRPAEREDYGAVLAAVRACGGRVEQIVHLWLTEPSARWSAAGEDAVSAALERGFLSLLALAQALGEQPGEFQRVTIVTSELQDVASGEGVCAAKALAIGPCLVIPQEYRQIRCRNIDVAVHELQEPTETFLARLAAELRRETEETVVALRGADRWVQEVARARLPAIRDEHGLRARGVYLITGGLGGLGLAMAEYLHRAVDARLVLVGRTIGRHLERVEALRRAGAELLVRSADVSDRVQLAAVVEEAEARFGAVHGVIHAAGAPPSGLIQRKTRPMAESVMRPKVYGVLALAEVLRDRKLDFLCLFSSVSSMTGGGPGQIDYCAANAFMDAYARQHFHEHGMTFSIAWGEWQWNAWEEGLLGFPAEARRYFIEKRRAFGLSFDEGTEAFGRILRHRIPNTFVATQDFAEMVEGSKNFSITTILEAEKRIGGRRPMHPRPALAVSYVAPASEAERRLAQIWGDLLGFSEVGIHDNFFDLGGNSLLGVDLIARIGREFELAVPAHLLYQAPTIASLAVGLAGHNGEPDALAQRADRGAMRRRSLHRRPRGLVSP